MGEEKIEQSDYQIIKGARIRLALSFVVSIGMLNQRIHAIKLFLSVSTISYLLE